MNRLIKRGLALAMVLVMCLSFLPMLHIKTSAADVNYVYDGKYSYNCIGRVESNGYVYDGKYSYNCIGRVESAPTKMGGAAYLLLLR